MKFLTRIVSNNVNNNKEFLYKTLSGILYNVCIGQIILLNCDGIQKNLIVKNVVDSVYDDVIYRYVLVIETVDIL